MQKVHLQKQYSNIRKRLQSDPNASIYLAISRDYLLLNKFDRAVETAGEAVRLDPKKYRTMKILAQFILMPHEQI